MERFLSVSLISNHDRCWPAIRITGAWVQKAGFDYGDQVKVLVEPGKLTVTKIVVAQDKQKQE